VVLALVLCAAGWKAHQVDRLQTAALRLALPEGEPSEAALPYLESAARLNPEDGDVQLELGRARLRLFETKSAQLTREIRAALAGGAVLAARADCGATLSLSLDGVLEDQLFPRARERLAREHLFPALRHFRTARDACPLLCEPHLMLGTYANRFATADSREAYLGRVKRLAGGDAELWYLCGIQEMRDRQFDRTWASWRRSLELSDRRLVTILEASALQLDAGDLVDRVLPDRPALLLTAARHLYSESEAEKRRPFLAKALRLLDASVAELPTEDLAIKGAVLRELERRDEARETYRQLVARQPEHARWRYELAEILREQGKLDDARRELVIVLAREPNHPQARELMALVSHELARQK
jgi:tetratricopeptide (TPR) repeat protein